MVEGHERVSQMSQPTEQRSSVLGKTTDGGKANQSNREGLG